MEVSELMLMSIDIAFVLSPVRTVDIKRFNTRNTKIIRTKFAMLNISLVVGARGLIKVEFIK